ncbi:hypothetical protein HanRHA438_Chr00c20g0852091 [Helianthus annuus]|uniref:Uncharacterized protein n=1 Tax=Helianthus annuus TaxID=4232 RepID=A0A9K3JMC7_HELAN|nr:hypothetical protein HanXRQr2_Chr02g0050301 [Helianthus annuus]KAJ0603677.1 hypothetical protein HanHA300_Chr02g0040971 [Helianthus annuus]KAJ0613873.1 hypothetical protein HanIR_Chr02g0056181 [Helianthus annuus]KAJ0617651.1 hypothetical protein HanHA89_Chr02g0044191 [Helianthus annuus]KAJ0776189.1 hypothetical protein HanLR1_Chr02g0042741 [Helianthus annuus]
MSLGCASFHCVPLDVDGRSYTWVVMRRGILDIVIRFNTIGQQWYLYLVYFEDNPDLICMPFPSRRCATQTHRYKIFCTSYSTKDEVNFCGSA